MGATFTIDEPHTIISEDFLVEMIKLNTGDRSWDENQTTSVSLTRGLLLVSQSRRVHEEIRQLINLLRQFN